jgi:hypothetical protein
LTFVTHFFDQGEKWICGPVDVVKMTMKGLQAEREYDELSILSAESALYRREMIIRERIIVVEPCRNEVGRGDQARFQNFAGDHLIYRGPSM